MIRILSILLTLVLTLNSLCYLAKPPSVDVRPFIELSYVANPSTILNVSTAMPVEYSPTPIVEVALRLQIGENIEEFSGILVLSNRTFLCDKLESWRYIPLFIPKNITIGQKVLIYRDSLFEATGHVVLSLLGQKFRCVILSNGSDTLIYDVFSGILIKGLLRLDRYKLNINLTWTNTVFRLKEHELYIDWYELTSYLKQVNSSFPGFIRVRSIGKSVLGRDIWVVEFNYASNRTILIDAGIHGSELIGVRVAYHIIRRLVDRYSRDRFFRGYLLGRDICISIIPMLNPDGVESGKALSREAYIVSRWNARYVDLNRNFPYMWSIYDSAVFSDPSYRGPYPASEPEVKAFIDYYLSRDVVLYISLHSGAPFKIVLRPSGNEELDKATSDIVDIFRRVGNYSEGFVGYYGSSICWTYMGSPRTAISLIVEVYMGEGDLFNIYNPVEGEEIDKLCSEFEEILLNILLYFWEERGKIGILSYVFLLLIIGILAIALFSIKKWSSSGNNFIYKRTLCRNSQLYLYLRHLYPRWKAH